jgi:hypothetical protein
MRIDTVRHLGNAKVSTDPAAKKILWDGRLARRWRNRKYGRDARATLSANPKKLRRLEGPCLQRPNRGSCKQLPSRNVVLPFNLQRL